jgi:hypothetical protein
MNMDMKQIFNGYRICDGYEIKINIYYYIYIIKISIYINNKYLQYIYLLVFL